MPETRGDASAWAAEVASCLWHVAAIRHLQPLATICLLLLFDILSGSRRSWGRLCYVMETILEVSGSVLETFLEVSGYVMEAILEV